MNFSLSEEQGAIGELARQIFSDACRHERLAEIEADAAGDGIDHSLWNALAEAGLLGVDIDEASGGTDSVSVPCAFCSRKPAGPWPRFPWSRAWLAEPRPLDNSEPTPRRKVGCRGWSRARFS